MMLENGNKQPLKNGSGNFRVSKQNTDILLPCLALHETCMQVTAELGFTVLG